MRKTHDILEEISGQEFARIEVPSGTKVFDWTVPREWSLREAHIVSPEGRRICDAKLSALHVLNYSAPILARMSRQELERNLFSLPESPESVPYRTAYYSDPPTWGFCIAHKDREALPDGEYKVHINAEHFDGALSLSECVLPGETKREVLLWSYTCHPAGAHHDLSANLVWAYLMKRVAAWPKRRLAYRFACGAETIGSLAYLAQPINLRCSARLVHFWTHLVAGYVLTCLGRGPWHYKLTRYGDTVADRAVQHVLWKEAGFRPYSASTGTDQLQFNSLGFNLPVGELMRRPYAEFKEYHTDQDNKSNVSFDTIMTSIDVAERILRAIDANGTYRATITRGMPQLGRRGLYDDPEAVTPLIQFSDGRTDLLAIAARTGLDIHRLAALAERCVAGGVLESIP